MTIKFVDEKGKVKFIQTETDSQPIPIKEKESFIKDKEEKNYSEDLESSIHKCKICEENFQGHKDRTLCKKCLKQIKENNK